MESLKLQSSEELIRFASRTASAVGRSDRLAELVPDALPMAL
jgi:hypothetical protein